MWKCKKCLSSLQDNIDRCSYCGYERNEKDASSLLCCSCGKTSGLIKNFLFRRIKGKDYCQSCADTLIRDAIANIIVTTTNNIDKHTVNKYIDIESVEVVIGTGMFSEISGDISDLFGLRSSDFEQKLQKGKKLVLDLLKYRAFEKGGNAVIAVDLDYTEFSGNRIAIIANGTIVEVVPIE